MSQLYLCDSVCMGRLCTPFLPPWGFCLSIVDHRTFLCFKLLLLICHYSSPVMMIPFSCILSLAPGAPAPPFLKLSQTGMTLGVARNCTSPLTVTGLYFGSWTFVVR